MHNMLQVSEKFYSVQGEGASVGVPAFFIRMQGCNMMCGGINGGLVKEGKATWWCDSEAIWRKGTTITNEELEQTFIEQGILELILNGHIHLVWTGGEPTIKYHQESIQDFINHMNLRYLDNQIFNEIETNGTLITEPLFYEIYINQINCSPKLSNSGIEREMRINPGAIDQIKKHENGYFKFVISNEDDIKEFQIDFIDPFKIPFDKIIIMPGVDNRLNLPERTRFLFEMTKKYGYRGITRQHILAWNRCVGV